MMMCIKALVCIWPGIVVSDRRDWISLKFIWHMTSNQTQIEFKKGGYMPVWRNISGLYLHGPVFLPFISGSV